VIPEPEQNRIEIGENGNVNKAGQKVLKFENSAISVDGQKCDHRSATFHFVFVCAENVFIYFLGFRKLDSS